jgi:signal transduction histidine kinase
MLTPSKRHRALVAIAVLTVAFAMLPVRAAIGWYAHPFAGILVDPDGLVSSFGLPTWDGFQQGLNYPDQILAVDGHELTVDGGYRAAAWDRAVAAAAAEGRPGVHVRVRARTGEERELDLKISRLEPIAFWLNGGAPIGIALLYVTGALVALAVSPRGRLSRTFAKTTLFAALFLFTIFDYHTTRTLVPGFHLAFAMVPMGFFALPLRLPDDVPLLERRPWIVGALDAAGLALGAAMIVSERLGASTALLRSICTLLFGASFFFFAVTFLVRFARARGDRRATLRALLAAMVPAHLVIGSAFVLGSLSMWGATTALCALPALALTPLSTVFALIRHDLWGSRALLSRVLMRMVIVSLTSACAIALGTGAAVLCEVPLGDALLASAVAGIVAGLLVEPALRAGDRALFPSRGAYKPTIEQLSEELTLITVPEEVGHAVERTVRRWLPCESVEFRPAGRGSDEPEASSGIRRLPPASSRPPVSLVEAPRVGLRSVPAPGPHPGLRPDKPGEAQDPGPHPGLRPDKPGEAPDPADELSIDVLFRGHPLAVLRVGKKRGGALFTSEDVDLLRTIGNQAALALAHAYSYAELEQRRRQQAAAWRGEREALVETVAAEIAHEVRYPINYFRSIFRRGQGHLHLDEEDVDIGCDEVERLERLVSGLRRVAIRRLERHRLSVEEIVIKAERLLRDQLGPRKLEVDIAGAPELRCDADQITQVLVNLLSNALDAAGDEGEVGVSWEPAPEGARLTVWDTGPGFVGDPARVFAPWYTTKPRGTGLGLAITHRIVRAHGWTIEPERNLGRTRFVITVPHSDILTPLAGEPGVEVA